MPRKRPKAVQAALERPRQSSCIDGLPQVTCRLLDRLDRAHLRSEAVRQDLARWHQLSHASRAELISVFDEAGEGNQWDGWVDEVRGNLQAAIQSLPRGHARALAVLVDRIDQRIVRRTHPGFDHEENWGFDEPPHQGWWRYRSAWQPEFALSRRSGR